MTRRLPFALGSALVLTLACAGPSAPPPVTPAPAPAPAPAAGCTPKQVECRDQQIWRCARNEWKLVEDCGAAGQFCQVTGANDEGPGPHFSATCTTIQAACPFVEIPTDDGWTTVGEILRNLNRPALYGSQSLALPPDAIRDGEVVVRLAERKAEVTHLDAIWLEVDGRRIAPRDCAGPECAIDGRWTDLHQGEVRTWVFPVSATGAPVLWAHGWYTPLSP